MFLIAIEDLRNGLAFVRSKRRDIHQGLHSVGSRRGDYGSCMGMTHHDHRPFCSGDCTLQRCRVLGERRQRDRSCNHSQSFSFEAENNVFPT